MQKKAIAIIDVVLLLALITFVSYGMRTACPDVAIYMYCGIPQ